MVKKGSISDDTTGTGDRPSDQTGAFAYYEGNFKAAYEFSRDNPNSPDAPFKTAILKTPYTWDSDADGIQHDILIDDQIGSNGAIKISMNEGWQAAFFLTTENNDYFEDSIQDSHASSYWTEDKLPPYTRDVGASWTGALNELTPEKPVWVQGDAEATDSRTAFILNGDTNDYFSADIGGDYNTIAQFRVRINNIQYFDNTKIDDETWIQMVWLRKWDATIPSVDSGKVIPDDATVITEDDLEKTSDDYDGDVDVDVDVDVVDDASIILILGVGLTVVLGSIYILRRS